MAKSDKTYTEVEQERIDAVNRYQRGERPSQICRSLGRSRVWLRKWIKRYNDSKKSSKTEWFKEESRAPKNVHRKTDSEAILHRKLPEDFEIGTDSLSITEGKVHFIRQVKGDGTISVLNENFDVGESLAYEYVWATIDTKQEQLKVYYQEKNAEEADLIKIYQYMIGENVKRFKEMF